MVATTVRTAIIFASVPQGLPATAAALNEASISVGSRIGIVFVTAVVAEVATAAYTECVAALPAADASAAISAFRTVLVAIGTPSFSQVATTIGAADVLPYLDAYVSGLHEAFLLCGVDRHGRRGHRPAPPSASRIRSDTVWDSLDERAATAAA